MKRMLLVGAALLVGATAVIAQSDPIAERRNIMKQVGAATRTGTQMVRGEVPFEAAKAKEVLRVYALAADKTHSYFPDTSKTGGETTASPKIWENQADFRKRFDDWSAQIKAASARTDSLDEFKAAFGDLTKSCGSCHQAYRISKS
jgi:cytochrome c556